MVCVDIDDDSEHEQVTTIVLGTEHDDITLARHTDGNYLIYDADMQRLSQDTSDARSDWEEGPDALRDPWLYEAGDIHDEDDTNADDDLEPLDIDGTPDRRD